MLNSRRRSVVVACAAAVVCLASAGSSAEAGLFFRRKMPPAPVVAEPITAGPVLSGPSLGMPSISGYGSDLPYSAPLAMPYSEPTSFHTSLAMPAEFVAPACCATPHISYRHTGLFKVRSCTKLSMQLVAVNPCTRCPVCVPVCLPACCDLCPSVSCRKALFGDGVVTYSWSSGVSVNVRFQRTGNVLVTYHRA